MFLPEIMYNINWLSQIDYRYLGNDFTYDKRSYSLLDKLFATASAIVPNEHGLREYWVRASRGSIEDFGMDFDQMLEDGEVRDWDEYVALWQDYYPDETDWIPVAIIIEAHYKAVFVGHKFVLECDDAKPHSSYEHDVSAFVQWLVDATEKVVADLRSGVYNKRVAQELPPQHRTGTIQRRDMYKVFPEWRKQDFNGISADKLYEFIGAASHSGKITPLKEMCANDFYKFCALGYAANGYDGGEMTPKEQYYRHADGRDEGLREIDANSFEEFRNWLETRQGGGHPFEVCSGGNSTHIDLFVQHTQEGYHLVLRGYSEARFIETINFYLTLYRRGLPVILQNAKHLVARVVEDEEIGIVPEGVLPAYCENYFPGKDVISFMNLPREKREAFAALCEWQDIAPIELEERE